MCSDCQVFIEWGQIAVSSEVVEDFEEFGLPEHEKSPTKDDTAWRRRPEIANLQNLDDSYSKGEDRRLDHLKCYIGNIRKRDHQSRQMPELYVIDLTYRRKDGVGLAYSGWMRLQMTTRKSREKALSNV